jgi:HAD superfamily hydrolase (TIGR01490 family)
MAQRAAFFDIDGTLTSDNVWKGIMDFSKERGERRATHYFFLAAHYPTYVLRKLHLLSETTFRKWWGGHLPWYFRGYSDAQMKVLAEWVAREHVKRLAREDVLIKLREHLDQGDTVALVSGVATPIVEAIAQMWQVPHAIGSPAEKKNGHYTGGMSGEPCIDEYKAIYIRSYFGERKIVLDLKNSFAYADSYSDLGMFEMVGKPVAVYPDLKLAALAKERGWGIID